jgi:hypothetical protein
MRLAAELSLFCTVIRSAQVLNPPGTGPVGRDDGGFTGFGDTCWALAGPATATDTSTAAPAVTSMRRTAVPGRPGAGV